MDLRWWVLLVGALLLAKGLFLSDSEAAAANRRERSAKGGIFHDLLHGDPNREPTARESILGGFSRLNWIFTGAGLVALAIFWNKVGDFFGQWFTRVN